MSWSEMQRRRMQRRIDQDRRVRKVRQFFWHLRDDINLLVIILSTFVMGAAFWAIWLLCAR